MKKLIVVMLLLCVGVTVQADLVGYYKFNDTLDDSAGSADGTFSDGTPTYEAGTSGSAITLDGVNDHVLLGTSSDYNFGADIDFSVALWVKTTGWMNDAALISNKDWNSGAATGWLIAGHGGGSGSWQWNYAVAGVSGRRDYDPAGPVLSDGVWHHICVTHDRDGLATFYFDGVEKGTKDISGLSAGSVDAGFPTVLGTDGNEGRVWKYWFGGAVDEVRIYNHVLTVAEVENAMNPDSAQNPSPKGENVQLDAQLSWEAGEVVPTGYDVYFGTDPNILNNPKVISDQLVMTYDPALDYATTYYWRVDVLDSTTSSVIDGATWTFTTKLLDTPPVVEAGDNVLTTLELAISLAMGGSVTDDETSTLTINGWEAFEALGGGGLTTKVTFADATDPATTATISEAGTYILKLTATDATGTVSDQKEIIVYADACEAAKATGEWTANYYDRDDDCDVDMADFAIFAAEWLNSTALDEGWVYEGDFGDPANALIADYWMDIEGGDPNDLLEAEGYPDTPAGSYFVTDELRGTLTGSTFGQRIYGYIVAPLTGDYTFYIASDDGSRLFLSSDTTPVDTNPALGNQIAEVIVWTDPDQWDKETEAGQASTIISLTAGQYYYIEVLHKENTGGDNVSVGWKLPGEATIEVIPATALRTELP